MKIPGINELIYKHIKKDSYQKYLDLVPNLKTNKNEKLLTAIFTIIASIILGIFAINPTISTIANLQKQLDDDKFIEQRLQEKINNLSVLDQKYQTIQTELPVIYAAIPKTAEIATLAAILRQISASNSSIMLDTIQTQKVELSKSVLANKKYSTYQFVVTESGSYQDLIANLKSFINFQRIVTLNDITIGKSNSGKGSQLEFSLTGTVYFKN